MFHTQLEKLYHEIHSCHICQSMDPSKALRRLEAIDSIMDVFIVSQALADGQLRKSGVNFLTKEGCLGSTGRNLEKFLNQFCRTVYPPREVRLASGAVVPRAIPPLVSVYNTELTQCFPGKGGTRGDRVPTATEIATCLRQNFLKREIALIKPKLILLMGDKTRQAFYKAFAEKLSKDTLRAHVERIVASGRIPILKIGEVEVSVLPIQHASGANPHFYGMLKNAPLIRLIRKLLAQS
jgi:uracil-DNA glycosylase